MAEIDEEKLQLDVLQEIAASLRELTNLTRLIGYPTIKHALETVLDSDEKRLVYHLTDGQRTFAEINKLTGINARYISEWGQDWERIGLVEPSRVSSVKGRRQKVFDLAAYGIMVPNQVMSSEGGEQN